MITAAIHLPELGQGDTAHVLGLLLTQGAYADALWILQDPGTRLAATGRPLEYREPAFAAILDFRSTPEILRDGWAGCAGAARLEAARYLAQGLPASVEVQARDPDGDYHAIVRLPDGRAIDPTTELAR